MTNYTNRLGFVKMPPGYLLIGLDAGHFLFERESDGAAGVPHSRSRRQ